jgi:hypothetical protein
MNNVHDENIDDATIKDVGLILTDKHINAETALASRVFEYPHLPGVYIMESDLYGNRMPKDSCFLAFNGPHGMIGKHVRVETLRQSTVSDIQQMVEENNEG